EDAAREEAAFAHQADPTLPLPDVVDARLLYDQGQYAEGLPLFERAIESIARAHARPMPDLHYDTADTLARLDRLADAEPHYLAEIRAFPHASRARAGLASLYQATGRPDEAGRALTEMLQVTPTPESYAMASRLWKAFGN